MQSEPQIESLLDAMHSALIAADFVALQNLTPELEGALTEFGSIIDRNGLVRLQAKAQRNAATALAAGKGVRAADPTAGRGAPKC